MLTLTREDAAQVRAILLTHAEMQDARINDSLAIIGRLNADLAEDDEAQDMVASLEAQVELFEDDSDNLKRLADKFV